MNEMKKRGRPKKKDRFTAAMVFRPTKTNEQMLDELAAKHNKTRSEIMREALEKYYYLKIMGQMTYFE